MERRKDLEKVDVEGNFGKKRFIASEMNQSLEVKNKK